MTKNLRISRVPTLLLLFFTLVNNHCYFLGNDLAPSKAALKQKKKREAKKAKKLEGTEEETKGPAVVSSVQIALTGDPELDKKLKNIKKVT